MRGFKGRGKGVGRDAGYKINGSITAAKVRLIDEKGTMLGVLTGREALSIAQERGLDLIEVAPNADPPTCKIMDYGKWKYENKKKAVQAKKKQTVVSIKEIQVRPRTDDHDIDVKLRNARKFLINGDKVKINLRFSGREMAHQDLGMALLNKVTEKLDDISTLEAPPKREGRQMFVLVAPDPVKVNDYVKSQKSLKAREDKVDALEAAAELEANAADPSATETKTELKVEIKTEADDAAKIETKTEAESETAKTSTAKGKTKEAVAASES